MYVNKNYKIVCHFFKIAQNFILTYFFYLLNSQQRLPSQMNQVLDAAHTNYGCVRPGLMLKHNWILFAPLRSVSTTIQRDWHSITSFFWQQHCYHFSHTLAPLKRCTLACDHSQEILKHAQTLFYYRYYDEQ